jgi:transcriptional regulator with XRE-family HTH domain
LPARIARAWVEASVSGDIAEYVLKKYDLTQAALARILQADQSYVSRVVRRQRSFTFAHLDAMAEALGVPMAVLTWRALHPPTPGPEEKKIVEIIDDLMRTFYPELAKEK